MKRKSVQTKYDVPVRRAFRWASEQKFCEAELHKIFRIPAECLANRNITFRLYRFSFHKPIKSRLARERLYLPFTTYKSTTESATLRPSNSGLVRTYNPALAVHFNVSTGL